MVDPSEERWLLRERSMSGSAWSTCWLSSLRTRKRLCKDLSGTHARRGSLLRAESSNSIVWMWEGCTPLASHAMLTSATRSASLSGLHRTRSLSKSRRSSRPQTLSSSRCTTSSICLMKSRALPAGAWGGFDHDATCRAASGNTANTSVKASLAAGTSTLPVLPGDSSTSGRRGGAAPLSSASLKRVRARSSRSSSSACFPP
jgi:hypothetical protein